MCVWYVAVFFGVVAEVRREEVVVVVVSVGECSHTSTAISSRVNHK